MTEDLKKRYLEILRDELIPAMGCTEPISVAYAAALARKTLGVRPSAVTLTVSGNIIKNVKSVVVPNTGGLRGLEAAVAAGIVSGNADAELEVLSSVGDTQKAEIASYLAEAEIKVVPFGGSCVFEIEIRAEASGSYALVCPRASVRRSQKRGAHRKGRQGSQAEALRTRRRARKALSRSFVD